MFAQGWLGAKFVNVVRMRLATQICAKMADRNYSNY